MKISLSVDTYRGVDGSSLSEPRCFQIVKVYEMLEEFGSESLSYIGLQELAESQKLFGSTAAKSAIRTFFPLLKKLEFVNYDGNFAANKCFTSLGTKFVLVCRAISNISDETPNSKEVLARLQHIKRNLQKEGIMNMRNNPSYSNNNLWLALLLLKRFRVIHWNEFLYLLHCKEYGKDLNESLNDISKLKDEIEDYEFLNEKGDILPNTCYTYLRSLLKETGIIENLTPSISSVTEEADEFFHALNI